MNKLLNYIARHWKGDLPYPFNFLINCVGITSAVRFLTSKISAHLDWSDGLPSKIALTYVICFATGVTVWGLVGGLRHLMKSDITAKISFSYLWIFVYTFVVGRTYVLLFQSL